MKIVWQDSTYIANIDGNDYQFLNGETYDLPDDNEFLNQWLAGRKWVKEDELITNSNSLDEIGKPMIPEKDEPPDSIQVEQPKLVDEDSTINEGE